MKGSLLDAVCARDMLDADGVGYGALVTVWMVVSAVGLAHRVRPEWMVTEGPA